MKKILIGVLILASVAVGAILWWPEKSTSSDSQEVTKQFMVSLGDSVAAGEGLETASDSSACNRTNESYPNVLAKSLNMDFKNIACSGATTSAGILGSQTVNGALLSPQIDQLFTEKQPNLITVTVGANDIEWSRLLTKCYTTQCGTKSDTDDFDAKIALYNTQLRSMLTRIQDTYVGSKPQVILTGYYQVFPSSTESCLELTGITTAEVSWADQQLKKLNDTIRGAAQSYGFAKYANVDFSGHELCTSVPWVQGIQDPAPFHPNEAGQSEIAGIVKSVY